MEICGIYVCIAARSVRVSLVYSSSSLLLKFYFAPCRIHGIWLTGHTSKLKGPTVISYHNFTSAAAKGPTVIFYHNFVSAPLKGPTVISYRRQGPKTGHAVRPVVTQTQLRRTGRALPGWRFDQKMLTTSPLPPADSTA